MTNMVNMAKSKYGERTLNDGRTRRFVVMLTTEEAEAIREYQHEQRIVSMSEAARILIKQGMPAPAGN